MIMVRKWLAGMVLIGVAILSLLACADSGDGTPLSPSSGAETINQSILEVPSDGPYFSPELAPPEPIRGIYLNGWVAGSRLDEVVDYLQKHDLNAVVIDIKDTDGRLSFALPGTLAHALGANAGKIGNRTETRRVLERLHEQGIYVIGRIALFQDNFLPHMRPTWALQTTTGELWSDTAGNYWLDPEHPAVLDYHVEIAVASAELGFDEIHFDYLRYPSQRVPGYNDASREQRVTAITDFITAARRRIQAQVDIPVSAAVFGIIAVSENDHNLGQDLLALGEAVEYVSPMFYPSHYRAGDFGLTYPNDEPYKTVFASTAAALGRMPSERWKQMRPWVQSFFGYDAPQVEAQIRALRDLGIDSFLVWNPKGRYIDDVDYGLVDGWNGSLAISPLRSVLYKLLSPAAGVFVPDAALQLPAHLEFLDQGSHALRFVATRQPREYRIEVRQRSPQGTSDGWENPVLIMSLTKAGGKHDTPPSARSSSSRSCNVSSREGAVLTWQEGGSAWCIWAPSREVAMAAKDALRPLPAELFR